MPGTLHILHPASFVVVVETFLQEGQLLALHLQVNLPSGDFYQIQKAAVDADFWTQLLCIAADRNPSLGMNYPGELAVCA
jgi:hypothetical protein